MWQRRPIGWGPGDPGEAAATPVTSRRLTLVGAGPGAQASRLVSQRALSSVPELSNMPPNTDSSALPSGPNSHTGFHSEDLPQPKRHIRSWQLTSLTRESFLGGRIVSNTLRKPGL